MLLACKLYTTWVNVKQDMTGLGKADAVIMQKDSLWNGKKKKKNHENPLLDTKSYKVDHFNVPSWEKSYNTKRQNQQCFSVGGHLSEHPLQAFNTAILFVRCVGKLGAHTHLRAPCNNDGWEALWRCLGIGPEFKHNFCHKLCFLTSMGFIIFICKMVIITFFFKQGCCED